MEKDDSLGDNPWTLYWLTDYLEMRVVFLSGIGVRSHVGK